jgi:hypothetical protein
MRRSLLISLIMVAQVGLASAQQPLPQPFPVFPTQASPTTDPTVEDVQASTDELNKQTIPDKDVLLLRELDRIDGEIARAIQQLQKSNSFKNQPTNFGGLKEQFIAKAKALAQFDCQNNAGKLQQALQSFYRAFSDLNSFILSNGLGNFDFSGIFFQPSGAAPSATCNEAKSKFSSADFLETQNDLLNGVQKALTDIVTLQTNLANAETKYVDALKKRRASVQDKLNTSQSAAQIGSSLWLLLLILAIACVGTILGIALFDTELQMEWVASGQVIQFVTVMILLSVILALGLSSILKENTLGTLLGGIAGYVLAQGVGRSAARNVERANAGAGGNPPGPTPPKPVPPAPVPSVAASPAPVPQGQ